jgi:hypothetical protein
MTSFLLINTLLQRQQSADWRSNMLCQQGCGVRIHSFLELLRNRLLDSLDHMLAFIYLAYSMMTLLYETVLAFEETWIECLGDLGRYRMAIEDDDIRDREV